MSDPANTPPPKPHNDTDGGTKIPRIGQPNQRERPTDAQAEAGEAADAGWLDAARQEAAHIEREATIHAEAHFDSCARWSWWNTALGFASAVLGALTATTIAAVLGEGAVVAGAQAAAGEAALRAVDWQAHLKSLSALGALVAGVVAAAVRFLDPSTRSIQHGAAGKRYRALSDQARQFGELEATAGAARDDLLGRLRAMIETRAEIHNAAPVIPKRAYTEAQRKAGEDARLKKLAAQAEGTAG